MKRERLRSFTNSLSHSKYIIFPKLVEPKYTQVFGSEQMTNLEPIIVVLVQPAVL